MPDEIDASGEPVQPRVIPRHRERDGRVEQDAEIVGIDGVLGETPCPLQRSISCCSHHACSVMFRTFFGFDCAVEFLSL